jgi:hypothetical protein
MRDAPVNDTQQSPFKTPNPYILIFDDFLQDFAAAREFGDVASFETVTSPVDNVRYPYICKDVPQEIASDVSRQLWRVMGSVPIIKFLFLRASPAGVPVPHEAHNDISMGQYSLMLYMNRRQDCQGGTSILFHRDLGIESGSQVRTEEELAVLRKDANDQSKWRQLFLCQMRPNRAFIFNADLFHRAEPIGGFGMDNADQRLVLTAFFDL